MNKITGFLMLFFGAFRTLFDAYCCILQQSSFKAADPPDTAQHMVCRPLLRCFAVRVISQYGGNLDIKIRIGLGHGPDGKKEVGGVHRRELAEYNPAIKDAGLFRHQLSKLRL